ncbi:MAG: hypothetical protein EPN93_06550 [Spirochaetes bacterium]|nr:MAG: hypothetical protein EPN93_06550 [Spirochaetota bacterium]
MEYKMKVTIPVKEMTVADKLEAMELLWDDLSKNPDNMPSPEWHEDVLRERENAFRKGQEQPEDWSLAKKRIRKAVE